MTAGGKRVPGAKLICKILGVKTRSRNERRVSLQSTRDAGTVITRKRKKIGQNQTRLPGLAVDNAEFQERHLRNFERLRARPPPARYRYEISLGVSRRKG